MTGMDSNQVNNTMLDLDKPAEAFAASSASTRPQYLQFHATGSEYFRILIVNLLLSIVTLGIYSAWAKVRRNQYFYSSTELAHSSFEYHGNAISILKGRVIAAVVVGVYLFSGQVAPLLAVLSLILMLAIMPWFMWRSMQFRLHNSAWRGIRFRFNGDLHDSYINYLVRPWLNGVSAGLAMPFVHQRVKSWQVGESRFGQSRFACDATVGDFYKLYGWFALFGGGSLVLVIWALLSGDTVAFEGMTERETEEFESGYVVLVIYAWLLFLWPLFSNLVQNMVWNHTTLDEHAFRSDVTWGRMLFITATNYLAVLCTLGLFMPFARVRSMRYRIESLAIIPAGSLDDMVAAAQSDVGAAGEGVAEFMDVDFSL